MKSGSSVRCCTDNGSIILSLVELAIHSVLPRNLMNTKNASIGIFDPFANFYRSHSQDDYNFGSERERTSCFRKVITLHVGASYFH